MSFTTDYLLYRDIAGSQDVYENSRQVTFLTRVNELNHQALTLERKYGTEVESYYDFKQEHPLVTQQNGGAIMLGSLLTGAASGTLLNAAFEGSDFSSKSGLYGALFGGLFGACIGSMFIETRAQANLAHLEEYESFLEAKESVLRKQPPRHEGLREASAQPLQSQAVRVKG